MYDPDNIFAKILRHEIPCDKVYENDDILAFYDIKPQADLHVIIIPKGQYIHYGDFISNANDRMILNFFTEVKNLGEDLSIKMNNTKHSYRIVSNIGEIAGQEINHFHVHVMVYKKEH